MNIQLLPVFEPFGPGLRDFVCKNPHYRFLVTHGLKTNPPRTPRRLIALLQHQLQQKGIDKPGFRFEVTQSRDVYRVSSAYGPSLLQTGLSHGVISIKEPSHLLEIGFNDANNPSGCIVKMEAPF